MPTLQIRIDAETFERVRARGGSPWARERILAALEEEVLLRDRFEKRTEPGDPALELRPAEPEPAEHDGLCPRWMHHRAGVFCKVCGELQ